MNEDGEHVNIQKLLHAISNTPGKVMNNKFKVKHTDVVVAPNQSFHVYEEAHNQNTSDIYRVIGSEPSPEFEPEMWKAILIHLHTPPDHIHPVLPANYQVAALVPIAPLNPVNNIEPADDTLDSHDDHLEGFDLSNIIDSESASRSGSMT